MKPRIRIFFRLGDRCPKIYYWYVPINLELGPLAIYYPESNNIYWGPFVDRVPGRL